MKIFRTFPSISCDRAAIGSFDGVHLGHRKLLEGVSAVITFDPLPSVYFHRIKENQHLLTTSERLAHLQKAGVDVVVLLPFTKDLVEISPEQFLSALTGSMRIRTLVMGKDFSIGKNAAGTPDVLSKIGASFGFETEVIDDVFVDGEKVSSTRIRELLLEGNVSAANGMLGYPYAVENEIIHGDARGRTLGYPTVNVQFPVEQLVLPNGVYASRITVSEKTYSAITYVGNRPTFSVKMPGIFTETHLLEGGNDFYGEEAKIEFIGRIRGEIVFPDAETLTAQIGRDIETAKKLLQ